MESKSLKQKMAAKTKVGMNNEETYDKNTFCTLRNLVDFYV